VEPEIAQRRQDWAWLGFVSTMCAPVVPFVAMAVASLTRGEPPASLCLFGLMLVPATTTAAGGAALAGTFQTIDGWSSLPARIAARLGLGLAWGGVGSTIGFLPLLTLTTSPEALSAALAALAGFGLLGGMTAANQVLWFGYAYRRCVETGRRRGWLLSLAALLGAFVSPVPLIATSILLLVFVL